MSVCDGERCKLQGCGNLFVMQQQRYESLGLREALQRRVDYARACKELATLTKTVYPLVSKGLQRVMFQDVLEAFRKLPEMDMSQQLSAANILLRSAEGVLPKQKKSLAVSEYKQAVVAQRRCHRQCHEEIGFVHFPLDILISIFRFLDVQSLAMTSLVCRDWNIAAQDNTLWQPHCLRLSENVNLDSLIFRRGGFEINGGHTLNCCKLRNVETHENGFWRNAFPSALAGCSDILQANRAYCSTCKALYCLFESPLPAAYDACRHRHGLRPVDHDGVANFVLTGTIERYSSSSDSDSDSEKHVRGQFSRMWTIPNVFDNSYDL